MKNKLIKKNIIIRIIVSLVVFVILLEFVSCYLLKTPEDKLAEAKNLINNEIDNCEYKIVMESLPYITLVEGEIDYKNKIIYSKANFMGEIVENYTDIKNSNSYTYENDNIYDNSDWTISDDSIFWDFNNELYILIDFLDNIEVVKEKDIKIYKGIIYKKNIEDDLDKLDSEGVFSFFDDDINVEISINKKGQIVKFYIVGESDGSDLEIDVEYSSINEVGDVEIPIEIKMASYKSLSQKYPSEITILGYIDEIEKQVMINQVTDNKVFDLSKSLVYDKDLLETYDIDSYEIDESNVEIDMDGSVKKACVDINGLSILYIPGNDMEVVDYCIKEDITAYPAV